MPFYVFSIPWPYPSIGVADVEAEEPLHEAVIPEGDERVLADLFCTNADFLYGSGFLKKWLPAEQLCMAKLLKRICAKITKKL